MLDLTAARTTVEDDPVDSVLDTVLGQLTDLADRRCPGAAWTARHFIPRGARTRSRRLFVEVAVDGRPMWIAKVPLNPSDGMVDREWDVLARGPHPRTGFTTPTAVERLARGFVMSWVPRSDFPDVLSEPGADAPAMLPRAAAAVARLHRNGTGHDTDARALAETFLRARYRELPTALVRSLSHARVGLFHGDLGPWNLRAGDGPEFGLIDWEDCLEHGVQGIDVLNLAMTSVLAADPGFQKRAMASLVGEMLSPKAPMGAAIIASLREYARATDQSAGDVGALVPLFCLWMEERIRRQGRDTDHLFYRPLYARFATDGQTWLRELG